MNSSFILIEEEVYVVNSVFQWPFHYIITGTVKTSLELSEEEWDQVMGTNLKGSWLVSKYVCTHMRDSKRGGSVISISSISGIERGQLPGGLAYAASKAGINTLTKVYVYLYGLVFPLDFEVGKYEGI